MTIEAIEKEIIDEFDLFGEDWEAKYEHLIDLGKSLPLINPEHKTEENIIKGCQSRVWLFSELINDKMIYTADADAIITKGMVAVLIRVLSNQKPEDIIKAKLEFIDVIGLKEHLSPTRANGLVSMITKMKTAALAFIK